MIISVRPSMDQKQLIASNADQINRLSQTINAALTRAGRRGAPINFRAEYLRLFYPGGEERLKALRTSDAVAVQTALDFLEVDPQYFRSGYLKEYIWKYIVRCRLTAEDVMRLYHVAWRYTEQRVRREFWYMCRAMVRIAQDEFWAGVRERLNSVDPLVRLRAAYLNAYAQGVEAGERVRREVCVKSSRLLSDT